jgi:hypothetical protein
MRSRRARPRRRWRPHPAPLLRRERSAAQQEGPPPSPPHEKGWPGRCCAGLQPSGSRGQRGGVRVNQPGGRRGLGTSERRSQSWRRGSLASCWDPSQPLLPALPGLPRNVRASIAWLLRVVLLSCPQAASDVLRPANKPQEASAGASPQARKRGLDQASSPAPTPSPWGDHSRPLGSLCTRPRWPVLDGCQGRRRGPRRQRLP